MPMIDRRKALLVPFALAVALSGCAVVEGRETPGEYLDDVAISTKIRAKLVDDPQVKATQIGVETMQGVVQLTGFVDSRGSAQRAEQLARATPGVKGVRNDLLVR